HHLAVHDPAARGRRVPPAPLPPPRPPPPPVRARPDPDRAARPVRGRAAARGRRRRRRGRGLPAAAGAGRRPPARGPRAHGRSTAHRGRLMVRQEEYRQRPEAVLVVDPGDARHVVTAAESSFETMLTATASILWLLRGRDFRVRLVDGAVVGAPRPEPWER